MKKKNKCYNGDSTCGATFLKETLECIVNQSYKNWEVIMCDDCSFSQHNRKWQNAMFEKYPQKFILLKNKENKGLNFTLNKCLQVATGEYIARMDGDDLCEKDRFGKR